MADTRTRWTCPCGDFRFRVVGVDGIQCQRCGNIYMLTGASWCFVKKDFAAMDEAMERR